MREFSYKDAKERLATAMERRATEGVEKFTEGSDLLGLPHMFEIQHNGTCVGLFMGTESIEALAFHLIRGNLTPKAKIARFVRDFEKDAKKNK